MNQEPIVPAEDETQAAISAESTSQVPSENSNPDIEISYGRITYISEEKGAFVELITGAGEYTVRAVSLESSKKVEIFVPKELIAEKKNLTKDLLVQLKRSGDTILDIEPF